MDGAGHGLRLRLPARDGVQEADVFARRVMPGHEGAEGLHQGVLGMGLGRNFHAPFAAKAALVELGNAFEEAELQRSRLAPGVAVLDEVGEAATGRLEVVHGDQCENAVLRQLVAKVQGAKGHEVSLRQGAAAALSQVSAVVLGSRKRWQR